MDFSSANFGMKPSRVYTNNLRLIKLAIQLHRCSRQHANSRGAPPIRVTRKALEQSYYHDEFASTQDAARKMAKRDLQYMEDVFSLDGLEDSGFYLGRFFPKYKTMFEFWLNKLDPAPKTDARLNIMLEGLIRSIENGMRSDPIVISDLASALKKKYGKKNVRDTKLPLHELFSDNTISSYLVLSELEDDLEEDLDGDGCVSDRLIVLREYDPILLRLKSRNAVGDNTDISINLALPGRVRNLLSKHCVDLGKDETEKLEQIASAVAESHCWQDQNDNSYVPYLLFREGDEGVFLLTLWNWNTGEFHDVNVNDIRSIPASSEQQFIPYGVPEKLWKQFRRLTA